MEKVEILLKTEDKTILTRTYLMCVPNQGHLVTFTMHSKWYTGRVTEVEHNTHMTSVEVTLKDIVKKV